MLLKIDINLYYKLCEVLGGTYMLHFNAKQEWIPINGDPIKDEKATPLGLCRLESLTPIGSNPTGQWKLASTFTKFSSNIRYLVVFRHNLWHVRDPIAVGQLSQKTDEIKCFATPKFILSTLLTIFRISSQLLHIGRMSFIPTIPNSAWLRARDVSMLSICLSFKSATGL